MSLLDHVHGESQERTVICEWEGRVPYFILHQLKCGPEDPRVQRFRTKLSAILKGDYKYIAGSDGSEELYNLRKDPEERNNSVSDLKEEREKLRGCLLEWQDAVEPRANAAQPYDTDEEVRKNLQTLGYI
jgi:hypothetical protein